VHLSKEKGRKLKDNSGPFSREKSMSIVSLEESIVERNRSVSMAV